MATWTWTVPGSVDTTVGASNVVQFANGTFDGAITVGAYNDSTHVASAAGGGQTDLTSGDNPNNVKFISQTGGTGGDSQADWGDGTEDIDAILTTECNLKINFDTTGEGATSTTSAIFYADDGTTSTATPTGVTFVAAEQGDTNFVGAEGSGSALSLADQGASTSHDFFILMSASPDSVGLKSAFRLAISLTYT